MKQVTIKPQDLLVTVKIAVNKGRSFTYADLAAETFMSSSEVHAAVGRAEQCRLLSKSDIGLADMRLSLQEFLLHGIQYCFPAQLGTLTRGIPTGVAGPVLKDLFERSESLPPVWPHPEGKVRGMALVPLYPSVPRACLVDDRLYEVMTLIDAIRGGAARERELGKAALLEKLA